LSLANSTRQARVFQPHTAASLEWLFKEQAALAIEQISPGRVSRPGLGACQS
jgi:hypothetical protein